MGPRDNIGAFLRLQALISTRIPVPVGPRRDGNGDTIPATSGVQTRRISCVYVDDVASAVAAALDAGPVVYGESINVAGCEAPEFEAFVRGIAEAVGIDEADALVFDAGKPALGFPSVLCLVFSGARALCRVASSCVWGGWQEWKRGRGTKVPRGHGA